MPKKGRKHIEEPTRKYEQEIAAKELLALAEELRREWLEAPCGTGPVTGADHRDGDD